MSYRNLNIFLNLCETLNLRQTAEQLRISPQYLSHYISDLEKNYQVRLFHRKPQLCLTYEGELLRDAAKDIQFYERNLESELQDLSIPDNIELHLGCSNESFRMVLPKLLSNYSKLHSAVKTTVTERSEKKLISMLEDGQLDLCLGINLQATPHIELLPLANEDIFLLVSDNLLRQHFPNDYPLCAERFHHGIRLDDFSNLPFLLNLAETFLFQTADQYCSRHGFALNYTLSSGSTEALMNLCRKGIGCLLCTGRYVPYLHYSNTTSDNYTYCFPVADFPRNYHLNIAYAKNRHIPRYVMAFVRCAQSFFQQQTAMVDTQRRQLP